MHFLKKKMISSTCFYFYPSPWQTKVSIFHLGRYLLRTPQYTQYGQLVCVFKTVLSSPIREGRLLGNGNFGFLPQQKS